MTDAELSALEAGAKEATEIVGWNVPAWEEYIKSIDPAAILELIAELRQARKERDWLAEHRPARYCPTVEKWETCLVDVPGHKLPKACIQCWIDRAKEATCPQI